MSWIGEDVAAPSTSVKVDVIDVQDELVAHHWDFYLWPKMWKNINYQFSWVTHRLSSTETPQIPTESGLYTLLVQPGVANHPANSCLMYVGKTRSLRTRFRDYLGKERRRSGRPKLFRLLNKYSDHIWFCYTAMPEKEVHAMEKKLQVMFSPPCNKQYPAEFAKVIGAF